MMKVIIYGSAQLGVQIAWNISLDDEILFFIDSDPRKHSKTNKEGIKIDGKLYPVYSPDKIKDCDFDKIYIASEVSLYIQQMFSTLKELGVDEKKIDLSLTFISYYARLNFIKTLSLFFDKKNIKGAVAELGVFRGDTAKRINEIFKNDEFYLLDTFEGFDLRDCENESVCGFSKANVNDFSNTSLNIVKSKMPFLDKCHFIKGYFPETSILIPEDIKFKFVNIDVDLYSPIYSGCKFFFERLTIGGVLLVHDYFHPYYKGVKEAVDKFCSETNLDLTPIGDAFSVMIIKK
ncbi:methyltransferase [Campylobacter jejuni]|nr:methyltransferase [Campylobacter jejuni]ELE7163046.1 hypothetical protein [Campylobacter jejuni]ELY6807580.1 hypothetical protein [Campylobacter jejuni]HED7555707.1 hypothetical protein [Campylobacter jejuni]